VADDATDRVGLPRALAHPAFLIVLTAALTGLLAPWITNRWEQRDKRIEAHRVLAEQQLAARRALASRELELTSGLVGRIGGASAQFLSAIEVHVIDRPSPAAAAEYRALKTASLEIASQLAAYFPGSLPESRWRDYTYSLRNAYILLTTPVGRPRNLWLDRLNRYLDVAPTQLDGLCFPRTSPEFQTDLRELVVALQNKEQGIVRDVTSSRSVLTGTPTRDVNVPRLHYDPSQRRPCDAYF